MDAKNTLESAFFSLSSAIRTGKSKISDNEATDLELDSDLILEIAQTTSGIALALGLIVFIYRSRNRFNKLVKRTLPKSKYPPGQITESNPPYNPQVSPMSQFAPTNQQIVPFANSPNQDFASLHGTFKPTFKAQATLGENAKQIPA